MAKGRPNKGLAHLDKHDVSELSRIRSRIVLQTVMGELSVHEACERLGIDRSRFARLRDDALRQYQEAFEPGSPGRPVERDVEADAREQELRDRIAQLERELRYATARARLSELEKKPVPETRRQTRQEVRRLNR